MLLFSLLLPYSRRILFSCVFFFIYNLSASAQAFPDSLPLRILVIRHGEKPDTGLNLNCKGWNRAQALPAAIISQFGKPNRVYVPEMRSGKKTKSVRMYQTVVPFAIKYDLQVNSNYDETDSVSIAEDLKRQKGLVLVVWDKKNIHPLVRNLGIRDIKFEWSDKDYDSIWIIEFIRQPDGGLKPQLRIGKEGITPSEICN